VAAGRDEVKLEITGGWSDLARRIVHHSDSAFSGPLLPCESAASPTFL
jgi:hypothetical protein